MPSPTYRLETADGAVIAANIRVADSFGRRFLGLMGRRGLAEGEGLCIQRCKQIHMFFMRFPIDVAFVDGDGRVLHVLESIKPWRISGYVRKAKAAIELRGGVLREHGVRCDSIVRLEENPAP